MASQDFSLAAQVLRQRGSANTPQSQRMRGWPAPEAKGRGAACDPWAAIHDPFVPLVVEPGAAPLAPWVEALLARAPFAWRATGPSRTVAELFPEVPAPLQAQIAALAKRFAALMGSPILTVRVEGVTGNACTRMHADYTDVRLILTLAGPGTEHLGGDNPTSPLQQLPAGHVGLFKGRTYPGASPGRHAPCLHRSPPIEGSGQRRLVLVIDTATAATEGEQPGPARTQGDATKA